MATDTSQNVLDEMTAGIMGRKAAKATQLTPVGMERQIIPDAPGSFMAQEGVMDVVRYLRQAATEATRVADEIERGLGIDPVSAVAAVDIKLAEREADRRAKERAESVSDSTVEGGEDPLALPPFASAFAAQQAAAQAAVFGDDEAEGDREWSCPTHKLANLKQLTSRKGRTYWSCTACGEFEK